MNPDFNREMYLDIILDLNRNPKNHKKVENQTHGFKAHNAFCGDMIEMQLVLGDNKIKEIGFQGESCAICRASASLITEKAKNLSVKEILELKSKDVLDLLGIKVSPVRIKCALLPLEALQKSLK